MSFETVKLNFYFKHQENETSYIFLCFNTFDSQFRSMITKKALILKIKCINVGILTT